jgi:probable selenium-dependent hydroxylase accessory protein YqeC
LHPVWVHRAERAAGLLGVPVETPLTVEHIVELVKHPLGCLKGIPLGSRKVALLNQADSVAEAENARELGRLLIELGFNRAVITSYLASEPVKEVIIH